MTRVTPILIVTIFLTSLLIVPSVLVFGGSNALTNIDATPESQALISQLPHDARVAIYDEDNLTVPSVSLAENFTNNLVEITSVLEGAGHSVEALTEVDILAHELITADYDVFILVNNVPRPSISKLVKEFWLGGGSLLTFNGALSYLWYEEIIYPGYAADPRGWSWDYGMYNEFNVTSRHPTMRDHHINDTVTPNTGNWAVIAQTAIDLSDLSYYFTTLLNSFSTPNHVSAFALDSRYKGGRIVHLPGNGDSISADFQGIIVDSVEWLIPKPKGRIVYDLTHSPRLSVDEWDALATLWTPLANFEQFRTLAVNHSYTFDKLYPLTSGNLTAERLAKYDILVLVWPDLNYTSTEMSAVEAWVNTGGSLLVLGDRNGLIGPNRGDIAINNLLQNFDMSLGTTNIETYATVSPGTHVTLEYCLSLRIGKRNHLSVIGDAVPIWLDGTEPVVAGQIFGQGRAILAADMNIFDNELLGEAYNEYFANNVLNWLSASEATILLFDSYFGIYGPPATALKDLGEPFQMLSTNAYVDDFLDSKSWDLFVVNQPTHAFTDTELDAIYAYVNNGGKVIMSYYDMDGDDTHPVWSLLGVEYSADLSGEPTLYLWNDAHPIFNQPNDHGSYDYIATGSFFDDGDTVTVLAGFTALAGATATEQDDNAFIVLGNNGRTLFNSYLLDGLTSDEDDSTYEDSIELWQNEIVYVLAQGGGFILDTTTLLIIGGVVAGIIVLGALASRRRGGSSSKPKKKTTKKKTKKK